MATKLLYHFNNSFLDSSGNNNTLPLGGSFSNDGKFNQGFNLDNEKNITIPTSYVSGQFTIEFWLKFTSIDNALPTEDILFLGANGGTRLRIATGNGGSNLNFNTQSGGSGFAIGDVNIYHHYAVTFDGLTYKIYKDGVFITQHNDATTYTAPTNFILAGNGFTPTGNVIIDEIRLSDSVIYTTNFTPSNSEFTGGSSVAKLAQITIGNKRFIEVDADPSIGGLSAPIGSMAVVNDGGVGRSYMKSGSLDTDWTIMATGSVDLSPYFKKDGSVLATGEFDLNSNKIKNLATGTASGDAVNKGQMDSALALKIDSAEKGVANGVATLGPDAKIPSSQIPAIAIVDTFVVASESAMLALSSAEQGDVAVRTDLNKTFILVSGLPSVLGNWQELLTPTDSVLSVNGQTGIVVLTTTNIAEGSNLYFTEARVLSTQLAGLSLASGAVIADGDSVIVAFGKLQKQINDEISARGSADTALQTNIDNEATARANEDLTFIKRDGSRSMQANLDMGTNKIINLVDPTSAQDASSKAYVDADGGTESIALDNTTKAMTKEKAGLTDSGSNSLTKITLPAIADLQVGQVFTIVNPTATSLSAGGGVFQSNGTTLISTFPAGHKGFFILINKAPETWSFHYTILRGATAYNIANRLLSNLTNPVSAQDAVTKSYADGLISALPASWLSPLSASNLNDATADLFFGTKSGDFDIKFFRNNEEFFSMNKAGATKKLLMNVDKIEKLSGNLELVASNNLIFSSDSEYHNAIRYSKSYELSSTIKMYEYDQAEEVAIANGDATKVVAYATNGVSSNRKMRVTLMFTSDQGDFIMEKDVHVNRANVLVLTQDSFTSKDAGVSAVECSMSFSSGILNANLSGMGSLTTKKVVMKVEEIVQVL